MKFKKKYLSLFPLLFVGLLNVIFYFQEEQILKVITSILLVPTFLYYYRSEVKQPRIFLQIAFLFSWIGDVVFLFNDRDVFVKISVVCYFLTQLFLILEVRKQIKSFHYRFLSMGVLLFASYLVIFLNQIYIYLGDMKVYSIIYGLTISYLGCISLMYFFQKQSKHRFFLFFGVLLYSFRDVLLTYNVKFFHREVFTHTVALLYLAALFFITRFFIYEPHPNHRHE